MAWSMSKASFPLTSPTTMRLGFMRRAALISWLMVISPSPSVLAFLVSRRTRFGTCVICNSAESSMVITRSPEGMKDDNAFRNVVFPEFVPPLINILHPSSTSCSRKPAASVLMALKRISFSMVIGSGNFLIVTTGPSRATGGRTTWTLEPSSSLASTIGEDTFTTRLTLLTICCMISSSCSGLSKFLSHNSILPFLSINIFPAPFTMISDTELSSISSCRISRRRKLSKRLPRSQSRSFKGRNISCPISPMDLSIISSSSPSSIWCLSCSSSIMRSLMSHRTPSRLLLLLSLSSIAQFSFFFLSLFFIPDSPFSLLLPPFLISPAAFRLKAAAQNPPSPPISAVPDTLPVSQYLYAWAVSVSGFCP